MMAMVDDNGGGQRCRSSCPSLVVRSDAVTAAAAAGGAAPSIGSSADSFDVSPSLVVLPDALAAASAGGEQRRGQGTLMGLGGSIMSKGGASQGVEAAGERNEFNRRQDRFLWCSLYVASCQAS
jgi:hypothetical protein